MKTFIRWSGNKGRYMKHIAPHLPKTVDGSMTYIEPFVGSGAVFLHLRPHKWIINDVNKDLINVWRCVKHAPNDMIRIMKQFAKTFVPLSKVDKVALCRRITSHIPQMPYNVERAALYLAMKYCAYMGDIVYNGKFYFPGLELNLYDTLQSTPYFLSEKYFSKLMEVSEFILNATSSGRILNQDFKRVLAKAKPGDFVFLDPPYVEDHDYKFTYNQGNSSLTNEALLEELVDQVKLLDQRGIKWLMTQADTPKVRKAFKTFKVYTFPVFRGYTNTYKKELIIKNY